MRDVRLGAPKEGLEVVFEVVEFDEFRSGIFAFLKLD